MPSRIMLAAALLLTTAPLPAQSIDPATTAPLSFALSDQFGTRWSADDLRGRWTVLMVGQRSHADAMQAWSDSLHHYRGGDSATVRWFMVADLRSVPRVMRRLANVRAPREAHRRLLFDPDGAVARQLKLGGDAFAVVVLSPVGATQLLLVNAKVSPTHLDAVWQAIDAR